MKSRQTNTYVQDVVPLGCWLGLNWPARLMKHAAGSQQVALHIPDGNLCYWIICLFFWLQPYDQLAPHHVTRHGDGEG